MITRREWSKQHCYCFVCGYSSFTGYGLETHEIVRGSGRKKSMTEPSTWLRACNSQTEQDCHRRKLDGMPIVQQLALKKLHDKEHYNRQRVNVLRRRQPDAITEAEVNKAMRTLQE